MSERFSAQRFALNRIHLEIPISPKNHPSSEQPGSVILRRRNQTFSAPALAM